MECERIYLVYPSNDRHNRLNTVYDVCGKTLSFPFHGIIQKILFDVMSCIRTHTILTSAFHETPHNTSREIAFPFPRRFLLVNICIGYVVPNIYDICLLPFKIFMGQRRFIKHPSTFTPPRTPSSLPSFHDYVLPCWHLCSCSLGRFLWRSFGMLTPIENTKFLTVARFGRARGMHDK